MYKIKVKNLYKLIHILIGALLVIVSLVIFNSINPGTKFIYPLCLLIFLLIIWCLWSWKRLDGNLFNPYILFLISLSLFNAGHVFLEVFGLNQFGILNGRYSNDTIVFTLLIVILSIYMLHLGALFAIEKKSLNKQKIRQVINTKALRVVGFILFAFSIGSSLILTREAISLVLSYGYMGLYTEKEIVTGFNNIHQILSSFLVPSAFFLLAGSRENRKTLILSVLIIAINTFIQFFLGSRTNAAMPLVAFIWLYDSIIKKIPRSYIISGALGMLFVVFPLLQEIRTSSGTDKFSLSSLVTNYFSIENPVLAIFKEMGSSMGTISATINAVPAFRDFDYGMGYFYALTTAVPNLFWDIHPSVAHGTYAGWISFVIDPIGAAAGYGYGFSAIAESYINFGWFGIFVFGFIGFGLVKFYYRALHTQNLVRLAMVAVFLSYFLFFARAESSGMVRPLLWYAFIPYIMYFILTGSYTRKRRLKENVTGPAISCQISRQI